MKNNNNSNWKFLIKFDFINNNNNNNNNNNINNNNNNNNNNNFNKPNFIGHTGSYIYMVKKKIRFSVAPNFFFLFLLFLEKFQ